MHSGAIHLNAVFVSPLLAFLAEAVAHHYHAVVTHSSDNGLGDAASGTDLAHARLGGNDMDDVSSRPGGKVCGPNHGNGRTHFLHLGVSCQARNHYLFQLQVFKEHICGVRFALLSSRRHAQQ